MTTVLVDVREFNADGAPVPTTRTIKVTPWGVRDAAGVLVTVKGDTVELIDGVATLELAAGYYRISGAGGMPSRTVQVPDVTQITLAALYLEHTVDPETLKQEAPAAWVLELDEIRQIIAGLEGADPVVIAAAVADYLAANPVEGVTAAEVEQTITARLTPYATTQSVNEGLAGKVGTLAYNNGITNAKNRDNHTGTQSADTIVDGTANKVYTAGEKTKLGGVAAGATVNATDGALRDRSTHTGTQTVATLSDFVEQVQDVTAGMFRAGTNVTFDYDDTAGTFTINAVGGGTGGGGETDPETVRDTIAAALVGGANVQVTVNDSANTITVAVTGLAPVATSGAYGDLTGRPVVPATPGDIGAAPASHTHTAAQVTDFQTAVGQNSAVAGNTAARHTHANKTTLDATTAPYTAEEQTKLAGIASGATTNATDAQLRDRGTHTGTQSADTLTDGTANKAYTAGEKSKLSGIATGATANSTDTQLRDRSTHTGTQPASTISDFQSAAQAAVTASSAQNLADTPLARAFAGFARRSDVPAVIVGNGSSFAADSANHGIFGQIISGLQRNFPKYDGTLGPTTTKIQMYDPQQEQSPVGITDSYTPTATGLQLINFATGGSTAVNQWTRKTGARAKAAQLNPCLHLWVIGVNDSYSGNGTNSLVSPAQFKAALAADIDYFLANQAIAPAIGLIHEYQRPDSNMPNTWEAYGDAMRELATQYPDTVFVIDTSPAFIRAGVPGNDPYDLVGADNLHPNIAGKALIADVVIATLTPRVPLSAPASKQLLGISRTVTPTISGTPSAGNTLTVSTGTWFPNTGLALTYQWLRNGVPISGATGTTYAVVSGDAGAVLTVAVTATVTIPTYRATTAITAPVTVSGGATPVMANTVAPTISGTPQVGNTLTASTGTWNPTDGTYAYQWLRNGVDISGATSATYALVTADIGPVSVRVTASRSGYTSASATSAAVTVTAAAGGGAGTMWTSDGFSTPTSTPVDMNSGRATDLAFGGTAKTWAVEFNNDTTWFADNGVLRPGTRVGNAAMYLDGSPADMDIEFKMNVGPSGNPGDFTVAARKQTGDTRTTLFKFKAAGFLSIEHNPNTTGSSFTYSANVAYTYQAGDVVICRLKGTTATILINGAVKVTHTVTAAPAGRTSLQKDYLSPITLDYIKYLDTTGV